MFVERFMAWSAKAGACQRSAAVCELAATYLANGVSPEDMRATEQVFTLYLQDPDRTVREALAEVLSPCDSLPKHLIWSFLQDESAVAAPFYAHSPRLNGDDLAGALALGCPATEQAIARRHDLDDRTVRLLVERGTSQGVLELLANPTICLGRGLLQDCANRLGDVAEIRAALLQREDLCPATRQTLVQGLSTVLTLWADDFGMGERRAFAHSTSDAVNRISVDIAARFEADEMEAYVAHLLSSEQLTPGLMLRALVAGQFELIEQAFAQLSGLSALRVRSIMESGRHAAFEAMFRKTGLSRGLHTVFAAGIDAWTVAEDDGAGDEVLATMLIAAESDSVTDSTIYALLGRMAGEAYRDASRTYERQLLLAA